MTAQGCAIGAVEQQTARILRRIMKVGIYPGSFDPFTDGHLDIARRAGRIFDKVIILISSNSSKGERLIPVEDMGKAIIDTLNDQDKYMVGYLSPNLSLPDFIAGNTFEHGAFVVRGMRDVNDAIYEMRLAEQYRWFDVNSDRMEVIPLFSAPDFRSVSSSLVREMIKYGKENLPVPPLVNELIKARYNYEI